MRHTITVLVENRFGVLTRIAGLFSGRGFNIETLNVGPTHRPDTSRMTIVVVGDDRVLDQVTRQLNKLVDVIEVTDFHEGEYVDRELVLLKFHGQLSNSELARALGISESNAGTRLHRALTRLREHCARDGREEVA